MKFEGLRTSGESSSVWRLGCRDERSALRVRLEERPFGMDSRLGR